MRIERDAATRFVSVGLPGAVDLPTLPESLLQTACSQSRLLVATDDDAPIGFALLSLHGGDTHLDELDVASAHGGRGVGRALLDATRDWARAHGCKRVTLTTFRDVPFNAPFYERFGFIHVNDDERLLEVLANERAHGIDLAPRVAMALSL